MGTGLSVLTFVPPFRDTVPEGRPPSPRTVSGWILTHPDALAEKGRLKLKSVLAHCSELDALAGHVRSLGQMLTQRQGERLPEWIAAVRADDLPSMHTFINGLERDLAAALVVAQHPDGEPACLNYGPSESVPELPADLRMLAVDALDQVVSDRSELAEQWAEAANWSKWRQEITRLRDLLDGKAREPLKATYLRPLRDAEGELRAGRGSRLSQILAGYPTMQAEGTDDFTAGDDSASTLVGILRRGEHHIRSNSAVKAALDDINKGYLEKFSIGGDVLRGEIGVAGDATLSRALERLAAFGRRAGMDPSRAGIQQRDAHGCRTPAAGQQRCRSASSDRGTRGAPSPAAADARDGPAARSGGRWGERR